MTKITGGMFRICLWIIQSSFTISCVTVVYCDQKSEGIEKADAVETFADKPTADS